MTKTRLAPKIAKIGIYTSGGDAPGMNAAIRAVVRTAVGSGISVVGIKSGYNGMLAGEFEHLSMNSVANMLQRGGTILKTGRSLSFHKQEVRAQAAAVLKKNGIDGLVCIGGDGSFKGALALSQEHAIPVIGIPGTIDNDIFGTDFTIGFDSAVNTALDAIDKIRDTAASHDRLFIVEVMGRDTGFIALDVGLAGGAEEIFIPENPITVESAADHIKRSIARGKLSSILVVAEGATPGRGYELAEQLKQNFGFESKVCILGHIQRGGSPTAFDRVLASRLGHAAVEALKAGLSDVMVGLINNEIKHTTLLESSSNKKSVRADLIALAQVLSA